ncbi:dTMP kinase [Campylobacter sp. 19-13652]|uniref:dTMP kinase n=1 Tax=Campylobacter sp. 19-13652 TaxID=2840180 RepID=UPI001C79786B|nr:dTMP kinase [Campylobacter sp. 19-13652]BCX79424.1 thymidylate kinase [Campylobacter sp. 19-13652]
MIVLFEGIDGVGKSTQISLSANKFKDVIITKEPGATALGERLRDMLLGGEFRLDSTAEMFLFLADRAQHAKEILSAHKDKLILSDRGLISGIAYAMNKLSLEKLIELNRLALGDNLPDIVVLLLANKELLATRLANRGCIDAIESRGLEYLMQIQKNMLLATQALALPYITIDASEPAESINKKIIKFIKEKL